MNPVSLNVREPAYGCDAGTSLALCGTASATLGNPSALVTSATSNAIVDRKRRYKIALLNYIYSEKTHTNILPYTVFLLW